MTIYSGWLYRGDISKSPESHLLEAAYHTEHFDTFYEKKKLVEKLDCVGQKTDSDKGGLWEGLETHILGQISYFVPIFMEFGAGMCIFEVKESIYRSFA